MKTIKFLSASIFAVMLTSCGSSDMQHDASGIFETTEVIVSAKSMGEIKQFAVDEGGMVRAGECLGYIDTTQLSLKRKQLVASLSATDSRRLDTNRQLASLRQQLNNAKSEQSRFQKLVADKAASQKQLDDINNQVNVLSAQLKATEESINNNNTSLSAQSEGIMAQVAQIDDQLANSYITSPIDGTILSKYAEQGEYAVAGRALCRIGNVEDMKLRAYITASQLTAIKLGQQVTVYADLGEEDTKEFEGTVSWISNEAEFTPKTIQTRDERSNLVYAIKINVKNDGTIKRGMYGDVKF